MKYYIYLIKYFLFLTIVLLLMTAAAKLISLNSDEKVLLVPDPIFGLTNHRLILLVAITELAVVSVVILADSSTIKLLLINWLSACFFVYRSGLWLVEFNDWCSCLGTLAKSLPITDATANTLLMGAAVFLFIGSGLLLFLGYKIHRNRLKPHPKP